MTTRLRLSKVHVLVLLSFVWISTLTLFAQSETATISGTISDQSGAVMSGAKVKLTKVETAVTAVAASNDAGLYLFSAVLPGHYRIEVNKPGFKAISLTDLIVHVQDTLSRNFKMQVGVVGESVTVSADAMQLNTTDGAVSTVVDRQFVQNMPLNGRSCLALIALTPGTVTTQTSANEQGQFSINVSAPMRTISWSMEYRPIPASLAAAR